MYGVLCRRCISDICYGQKLRIPFGGIARSSLHCSLRTALRPQDDGQAERLSVFLYGYELLSANSKRTVLRRGNMARLRGFSSAAFLKEPRKDPNFSWRRSRLQTADP